MAPRKVMLAFFFGLWGPIITAKRIQSAPAEINHFSPMVFDVVGRNIFGYWYLEKVCYNPTQLPVHQPCISQRRDSHRYGQIGHTYAYFSRPMCLFPCHTYSISAMYIFQYCANFPAEFISMLEVLSACAQNLDNILCYQINFWKLH